MKTLICFCVLLAFRSVYSSEWDEGAYFNERASFLQKIRSQNQSTWLQTLLDSPQFNLPPSLLAELSLFENIIEEKQALSHAPCFKIKQSPFLSPNQMSLSINKNCITQANTQQNMGPLILKTAQEIQITPLAYQFLEFLVNRWMKNSGQTNVVSTQKLIAKNNYFVFSKINFGISFDFLQPDYKLLETFWTYTFLLVSNTQNIAPYLLDYPEFLSFIRQFALPLSTEVPNDTQRFEQSFNRFTQFDDAQIYLLPESKEAWATRIKLIQKAKRKIFLTSYIFEDDIFAHSIFALLYQKATEGLSVYVMMDARGNGYLCGLNPDCPRLKFLTHAGVHVGIFNPIIKAPLKSLIAYHDKILLVDDQYLITGGRNIAHQYFSDPQDAHVAIKDFDILVKSKQVAKEAEIAFREEFFNSVTHKLTLDESPAAFAQTSLFKSTFKRAFLAYWGMRAIMEKGIVLPEIIKAFPEWIYLKSYLNYWPSDEVDQMLQPASIKLIDKNTKLGFRKDLLDAVLYLINSSTTKIIIENAYFVLTPEYRHALKNAALRGVKIIIYTNSTISSDSGFTQTVFNHEWKDFMNQTPGCELFASRGPWLKHAKVLVVDNHFSLISSYNFDPISAYKNSEIGVLVNSPRIAQEITLLLEKDNVDSEKLDPSKNYPRLLRSNPLYYWLLDKIRQHL